MDDPGEPRRRRRTSLLWALLVLPLPLALVGALMPVNEYKSWGLDALDCDGPDKVFALAGAGLLVYAPAALLNARRWRSRWQLAIAALCLILCALLVANIVRAAEEKRLQAIDCGCR